MIASGLDTDTLCITSGLDIMNLGIPVECKRIRGNERLSQPEMAEHVSSVKCYYPLVNEHIYGISPYLMGKPTISMAIFHSYVRHYQRVT